MVEHDTCRAMIRAVATLDSASARNVPARSGASSAEREAQRPNRRSLPPPFRPIGGGKLSRCAALSRLPRLHSVWGAARCARGRHALLPNSGCQRGRGRRRLQTERGHRHLPNHSGLDHGRRCRERRCFSTLRSLPRRCGRRYRVRCKRAARTRCTDHSLLGAPPSRRSARAGAGLQRVTRLLLKGRGDELPVSAFPPDGTWPSGTSQFEKRARARDGWRRTL
jgi:hypothetical protein